MRFRGYGLSATGVAACGIGLVIAAVVIGSGLDAANTPDDPRAMLRETLVAQGVGELAPPPDHPEALVELGRLLFFDPELSGNRNISCATCHHPAFASGDALSVSFGSGGIGLGTGRTLDRGALIARNAPEIFNRADPAWQSMFWDSRIEIDGDVIRSPAGDHLPVGFSGPLAIQALFPVSSADEMRGRAGDLDVHGRPNEIALLDESDFTGIWNLVMARITAIPAYVDMFRGAFPDVASDDLSYQHAAEAIAAFEAEAFTFRDSPWDLWLAGDDTALNDAQVRGASLFFGEAGCASCHSGTLLTDQLPHNIGAPQVGPGRGASRPYDFGRFLITGEAEDLFAFRTPPLRNVAVTGPWMHNGAFHELEQAVRHHFAPQVCWAPTFQFVGMEPELEATVRRDSGLAAAVLSGLDPLLPSYRPKDADIEDILAFLEALTSPTLSLMAARVPETVPSGLPVDTAVAPADY